MEVIVNVKKMGKRRNSVEPVPFVLQNNPQTIQELITETVRTCVNQYNDRLEHASILQSITAEDIADQEKSGKIGFQVNYGEKSADFQQALENALCSFEDGIYRIFIDDQAAESLAQPIHITENTKLTFVRLTMLAGRLW